MTVTMKEVRRFLDSEEPNYSQAAQLGDEALPYLDKLVKGTDPMLASKAVYLASLIGKERAVPILKAAASSADASVRVATAAAARNLPGEQAGDVLLKLVQDADPGIRKTVMKSVSADAPAALRTAVEAASQSDASTTVRDAALRAVRRLKGETIEPEESAMQDTEALGTGQGGGSVDFGADSGGGGMGGGSVSLSDVGSGEGGGSEINAGTGQGGGTVE